MIVGVLTAQGAVSLLLPVVQNKKVSFTWPFLNYPMYRAIHHEGDRMPNLVVLAIDSAGNETLLDPKTLPVSPWYYEIFARAVVRGEDRVARDFLPLFSRDASVPIAALRVVDRGTVLYRRGNASAPEIELGVMRLDAEALEPRR